MGCNSTCTVETKWTCSGGSTTTASTWSDLWGDGFVTVPTAGYWDDGNSEGADGCDSTCAVEVYWEWTLGDINDCE